MCRNLVCGGIQKVNNRHPTFCKLPNLHAWIDCIKFLPVNTLFITCSKQIWYDVKRFVSRLVNPEITLGAADYYVLMLLFDTLCLLTIIFGFSSFGVSSTSTSLICNCMYNYCEVDVATQLLTRLALRDKMYRMWQTLSRPIPSLCPLSLCSCCSLSQC